MFGVKEKPDCEEKVITDNKDSIAWFDKNVLMKI